MTFNPLRGREAVEIADRPTPTKAQKTAEALALYSAGLSIRRAGERAGLDRETVRKAAKAAGIIRARLNHIRPIEERLERYKVSASGCWLWQGRTNNMGYGIITVNGRPALAHRAMCAHRGRPIPAGLDACHRCDTPGCVNPDHIFAGTRSDNMRDAAAKGRLTRRRSGC